MSDPIIVVQKLCIGWSRDAVLLENASFNVERGEIFAILGPSGAGKSTLLRALVGLDRPLDGAIWIDGKRHDELSIARPSFGMMFQSGALFGSLSLLENVTVPLVEWTRLPKDVIEAMGRAKLQLVGLEGNEDKVPAELSGGMRKRAALARAIALEPSLVFLDEPTAGLDPVTSLEIDELLLKLNRITHVTFVMVTHELASIGRLATRCVMLDLESRGIIAEGIPHELAQGPDPRVREFFHQPLRT